MNEGLHAGRIDFLKFAGDPKTSDSNKLIVTFSNLASRCVLVEVGKCKVKGLLPKFEAQMNIDKPID